MKLTSLQVKFRTLADSFKDRTSLGNAGRMSSRNITEGIIIPIVKQSKTRRKKSKRRKTRRSKPRSRYVKR